MVHSQVPVVAVAEACIVVCLLALLSAAAVHVLACLLLPEGKEPYPVSGCLSEALHCVLEARRRSAGGCSA